MTTAEVRVTRLPGLFEKPDEDLNGIDTAYGFETGRKLVDQFSLHEDGDDDPHSERPNWRKFRVPSNNKMYIKLEHQPEQWGSTVTVSTEIFGKLKQGLKRTYCTFYPKKVEVNAGDEVTFELNNKERTRITVSHKEATDKPLRRMGDPSFYLLPNIDFNERS